LCYSEGIRWLERLVEAGMQHLMPDLVKSYWFRLDLLRQMGRWPDAAADVMRAVHAALPLLESHDPSSPPVPPWTTLLRDAHGFAPEERQQLGAALGPDAALVRQLIERLPPPAGEPS